MSQTEDPESNLTLEVTIPENSEAGDRITIQCPDDSYVAFVTPDNVVPGDTVHVMINDSTEALVPDATVSENLHSPTVKGSYRSVAAVTTVSAAFPKRSQRISLLIPIIMTFT